MRIELTRSWFSNLSLYCFCFLLSGFGGWVYEMLFYCIDCGHFIRRGHTVLPILPIYGFGALLLLLLLRRLQKRPLAVFGLSALISGAFEFACGFAIFHLCHGLRLWDYNTEIWNWGNVGGFVCLRSCLVFGLGGTLLVCLLYPKLLSVWQKGRGDILLALPVLAFGLYVVDVLFGYFL